VKIELKQLEVTSINNISALFNGRNVHHSWSAVFKANQGLGAAQNSQINASVNLVDDHDWQDSVT
jgi:hypothetical protein